MRTPRRRFKVVRFFRRTELVLGALLVSGSAACDDPISSAGSALRVSAVTTGGDPDLDGYAVTVGVNDPQAIGVNDTVVIAGVPAGSHDVELTGVAGNCSVSGDNPRPITVARGDTIPVAYAVACRATGVEVSIATTGIDLDPDGFVVTVDGGPPQPVGVLGTVFITRLNAGDHEVTLGSLAANCVVAEANPRSVTVPNGLTVPVPFTVGCGALTGNLRVTAATSGTDLDGNGYTLRVDGGSPVPLTVNGAATVQGLSGGSHSIQLDDAAGNCTVGGDNPRTFNVTTGGLTRDTARTTFSVSCVAVTAVVRVTAATSGIDVDPDGYTAVHVDEGTAQAIALNGTVTFAGLAAGSHSIRLDGVLGNCLVGGENPRTLPVTTGGLTRDTARTTFSVDCVAATGSIEVSTATSGADLDPNGFTIQVDGGSPVAVTANGTALIEGVLGGDHSVTLGGVSSNCIVAGQNPRTLQVTTGGPNRDTARTTFDASCVAVQKIAFTRYGDVPAIAVSYGDGSNAVGLLEGKAPTWSPDGTRIAYTGVTCEYYYGCWSYGLYVMQADGSGPLGLTGDGSDADPAWRSDGARIAFTRFSGGRYTIFAVNADGSAPAAVAIPSSVTTASQPDWSPDGTRLAFTCQDASGNVDICLVNADGTGFVRLTSDPARDAGPAWKPDGSSIAFTTSRFSGIQEIAVMNPDGSGVTRVTTGSGAYQPAWSPDGTRIAFAAFACNIYTGCTALGLAVVNADGTGRMALTNGSDYDPSWRP
jgi:Tol biopolymer transport system component